MPSNETVWNQMQYPRDDRGDLAELFHENTKIGRHDEFADLSSVARRMSHMHESLPYAEAPSVELPATLTPLARPFTETVLARQSAHEFAPVPLSLDQVGTLLHLAYGVTRSNAGTQWPRPFRVVPSGGALYPLEIYLHSRCVQGLTAGLHHFNPTDRRLRLIREGDLSREISEVLVPFQSHVAAKMSAFIFLTAVFERSTFKYRARGYRFILLEAGHVAQNLNLTATAMNLGCLNIGGFFDRELDAMLGLDGVTHSSLYMVGIGGRVESPPERKQ